MKNADIILGWVTDNGEVILHDRFATGYSVPQIDKTQNVDLLGGFQNDTHTVLRFSRPWNTCDQTEDLEISSDTARIIWAYGTSDPASEMGISYHTQRGTKSLYLQEPQFTLPLLSSDVQSWDVLSPDVSLPDDLTTVYWCKLFKLPPLPRKTHMIGYIPLIKEENLQHVHHILVYECQLPDSGKYYEKWLDVQGAQCFGANMPLSWKFCSSPIVAWAIGGEGEMFPEHVGFPLGEEHGGATYFMMETHYDNPNLQQGIVDNSGIRIFHTENLREYDAGIIMMGHDVSPSMMIPPGQQWLTIGICSGECTQKTFPDDGVKVFSAVLHSHLLGRNLTIRHLRNNKELPTLSKDMNYDFNFQQSRILRKEVTLMPGDTFIAECGYDSRERNVPTFGGFGTEEEMCLGFIYYYPRVNLAICSSRPTDEDLFSALGIQDIYRSPPGKSKEGTDEEYCAYYRYGINLEEETKLAEAMSSGDFDNQLRNIDLAQVFRTVIIQEPEVYRNQSLYDVVTSEKTWENVEHVRKLQDMVINGDHKPQCSLRQDARSFKKKQSIMAYPTFTPLPATVDKCSGNIPVSSGTPPEATDTKMTSGNDFGTTERNPNSGSKIGNAENESKAPGNNYGDAEKESKTPINTYGNTESEITTRPLACPPQLPLCNINNWPNSVLGNRPSFF
ncbi:DBH-like monooxygenase protein 1 [Halocaridina rubra]|uniref:DBH-like monooxygenase protein 1 n=1 Tax=Halocaridina rubra TaxID=373956 RepID=A0AAN9AE82_HALRR